MKSRRRILQQGVHAGLSVSGMALVLGAVLFVWETSHQLPLVVLGLLMIEVGVWKLAHRVLPGERQFLALRAEVDLLIVLVRQLNTAALAIKAHDGPETRQTYEQIRDELRQAVERIAEKAGKTDEELTAIQEAVPRGPDGLKRT